jgi:hypothetical protein
MEEPGIRLSWDLPVIGTVLQALSKSRQAMMANMRRDMGNLLVNAVFAHY